MNEALAITIPPGAGHLQTLSDGSIRVSFPLGTLPDYRELSEQFIHLGVHLMYRGREQHGDLKPPDGSPSGAGVRPIDSPASSVAAGSGEE